MAGGHGQGFTEAHPVQKLGMTEAFFLIPANDENGAKRWSTAVAQNYKKTLLSLFLHHASMYSLTLGKEGPARV